MAAQRFFSQKEMLDRYNFCNDATLDRLAKLSRNQFISEQLPSWKQLRQVEGDDLAFRALILRREGRETLVNIIRGANGLPNKY